MSTRHNEFSPDRERIRRRAVRVELVTIAYLLTAIVVVYLALGNSQAMKTAWVDDVLSLIPPIAFLVASRVRDRAPNREFPYGHHRATSIAYLCGSLSLLTFGLFILGDSLIKLVTLEHPSVGTVVVLGQQIWLGWLMILALLYSGVPIFILGRMKMPLARGLHDKALYADAEMNRADWMSIAAAITGVIGIGLGLWWADAVAATFISLDIVRDGLSNVRQVIRDLMDHAPTSVDHRMRDPLPTRVENELVRMPWVRDVRVRLREEGHVYFGEIFVIPTSEQGLLDNIEAAHERIRALDWRLHDIVIAPVREFSDEIEEVERSDG